MAIAVVTASYAPRPSATNASAASASGTQDERSPRSLGRTALLPLLDLVVPRLEERLADLTPPVDRRVRELAGLLVAASGSDADACVRQGYVGARSLDLLSATLLEPAARALGDMWHADVCSQFDVTLGLARLAMTVRDLVTTPHPLAFGLPSVLVAPQPGEIHLLGSSIDADLLWRAGWDSCAEFPDTDTDLEGMVAGTWFDALDLSLSAALGREGWLARMTRTIAGVRRASLNPALVVVVCGRAFHDHPDAGAQVGADASSASSYRIDAAIARAIRRGRSGAVSHEMAATRREAKPG